MRSLSELIQKIQRLKQERNAVVLAHNYQLDEVQAVADYIGDSFYLSKIAAASTHEVIVFCGVLFMAETAKLLSPGKTVLLPEKRSRVPACRHDYGRGSAQLKSEASGSAGRLLHKFISRG